MTCLLAAARKAEESEDDKSEPGSLSRTNSGGAFADDMRVCRHAVLWLMEAPDDRHHMATSEALSQAQTVG